LKRTSAGDLERLGRALYQAARGEGPLPALGVSQAEARVLIGLMASEDYPGLIREHLPGPVAHKAGWLDTAQTDLALAFGMPGGPCIIGVVTNGLPFASADAIGKRIADELIPLLTRTTSTSPAASGSPTTTTAAGAEGPPPSPVRRQPVPAPAGQGGGVSGILVGLAIAAAAVLVLVAGRLAFLRRRRVQRARAREARCAASRPS
jgi:hypothetical protein